MKMKMKIKINNNDVDLDIENLENIKHILTYLDKYTQSNNDIITKIQINNELLTYDEAITKNYDIANIIIELETESVLNYSENIIAHIHILISEILKFADNKEDILIHKENLGSIAKNVYDNLDLLSNILYVPFMYVFKNDHFLTNDLKILAESPIFIEKNILDNEKIWRYFENTLSGILSRIDTLYIPQMVLLFNLLYSKNEEYLVTKLYTDMSIVKDDVNVVLSSLEKVLTDFQLGRESLAMQGLEKLVLCYEIVSQLMLRASLLNLIDLESITDIQQEIQNIVEVMNNALINQDIVTLCDTLEYEYCPKIGQILLLLPAIDSKG